MSPFPLLPNNFLVIATIFLTVLLQGCASTKVHVYGRYLSPEQLDSLTNNIEQHEFNVIVNDLKAPTTIDSNSIIYSPLLENVSQVDDLIELLRQQNIDIVNVIPMTSGNHWYNRDSMGLIIFPDDPQNKGAHATPNQADLSQKYTSDNCELAIQLILRENGTFSLIGKNWTEQEKPFTEGVWKYRQFPYIEVTPDKGRDWTVYYVISTTTITDKIGKVDVLQLEPSAWRPMTKKCNFVFGTRH